jgi:uncharacterized protein (UPF0332 family)
MEAQAFLDRARENLTVARWAAAEGHSNAAASRAYFAAFHVATAALIAAGVGLPAARRCPSHEALPGLLSLLTDRRKIYPAAFKSILSRLVRLRLEADYTTAGVGVTEARRSVRQAESAVGWVTEQLERWM